MRSSSVRSKSLSLSALTHGIASSLTARISSSLTAGTNEIVSFTSGTNEVASFTSGTNEIASFTPGTGEIASSTAETEGDLSRQKLIRRHPRRVLRKHLERKSEIVYLK